MGRTFNGALRAGATIVVGAVSQTHALLASDSRYAAAAPDVFVDNRGEADAFLAFGGPGVVVDAATGLRVPAGASVVLGKAGTTHVALVSPAGTSITLHLGEGL